MRVAGIVIALAALLLAAVPAQAAQQYSNIACETSATTGTGTINLAGAISAQGYLGFIQSGITSGNTVPYYIKNSNKIEVGWGVVTDASPDTMTRTPVLTTDDQTPTITPLTLSGTSTVCIGFLFEILTNGAGYLVNADLLDGQSSTAFLPAGSDTYVQYNDGGVWGGDAGLVFAESTDDLTVGGDVVVGDDVLIGTNDSVNWESGEVVLTHASGTSILTLTGDSTPTSPVFMIGHNAVVLSGSLQVHGVATAASSLVARWSNDAFPPRNTMFKSRGAVGTFALVSDDDQLGEFSFSGADSASGGSGGASFGAYVDGTPGDDDMPARLFFATTPDNAATGIERMVIKPDGGVIIGPDDTSPGASNFLVDAEGDVRLGEAEANGDNSLGFAAPASVTGDQTCVLENGSDASFIPDSCVGDGTDGGGATITGTPADNQVTVWSSASAIEGDTGLTFDASTDDLTTGGDVVVGDDLLLGDADAVSWNGGAVAFTHLTGTNYLTFTGSGSPSLIIGHTASLFGAPTPQLQVHGTGTNASTTVARWSADSNPPRTVMLKSGSGTIGNFAVVSDDDQLGDFQFQGTDGDSGVAAAAFGAVVDGTPGDNDMPARLRFSTTPDGSVTPVERMVIKPDGGIIFGVDGTSPGAGAVQANVSLLPDANDGAVLGSATVSWSDLFLADGALISYNNGDAVFTKITDGITLTGDDTTYFVMNYTALPVGWYDAGDAVMHNVVGTGSTTGSSWLRFSNDAFPAKNLMGKSRGAAGAYNIVSDDDQLGLFSFQGSDGSDMAEGASIQAWVDGGPGDDDMPGRLAFYTTPEASQTSVARLTIKPDGGVIIGPDSASPGTGNLYVNGTIELGAASDTTLARSAAGKATIESKAVKLAGRQTLTLPAGAGTYPVGGAINSCSASTAIDSGSNDLFYRACQFDSATDNALFWQLFLPKSADESAGFIVRFDWDSNTTTDGSDDVIWTAAATCVSSGDTINANALGTAVSVTDTQTGAGTLQLSSESGTITPSGTWTEGDMCLLQVTRDADNGSDNFNGNTRLLAVQLYWTDNAANND